MKAEYVNSFYGASQDIFKLMLDLDVERGDLTVVEGLTAGMDANINLGVTGDIKGSILFSFTKDMTLKMVKIMSGMEMDEIDVFVSSALGEVENIISGNALTNLSKYNYKCDITPPQIIIGQHQLLSMANKKALVIPMKTSIGEFNISMFLPEGEY